MTGDTNEMLPIIRQMLDADSDQVRARILLAVSDAVLMRHRELFEQACQRAGFEVGKMLIDVRRAEWHAVRGADGNIDKPHFAAFRAAVAEFAGVAP
ncbi:hypothetical protein [Aminobacter aminovorans]|uniref:hypothetical protein n=1 Tax=Aminobacter aminovorans TaxID=83263 RepID=UPI0028676328|nr:hypothetical protein [Aminobacter aminovorans]MDR7220338.1 hypothetical protein [Aminobacter aminovorans]